MFNVVDLLTGWKIDFIIRKSRAFSEEEFRRRTRDTMWVGSTNEHRDLRNEANKPFVINESPLDVAAVLYRLIRGF